MGGGSIRAIARDITYTQGRITTSKHLPYVGIDRKCEREQYPDALKGWVTVTSRPFRDYDRYNLTNADNMLADSLNRFGPVVVGILAFGKPEFKLYESGIMDWEPPRTAATNHAVLCTGYTPDYFNIKNSWGVNWGMRGYVRFARRKYVAAIFSYHPGPMTFRSLDGKDRESFWDDELWWEEYREEERKLGNTLEYQYAAKRRERGKDWWRVDPNPEPKPEKMPLTPPILIKSPLLIK